MNDFAPALLTLTGMLAVAGLLALALRSGAAPGASTDSAQVPAPDEWPEERVPYLEVGEWSGRTYPTGAVVVGFNDTRHSRAALAWAADEAARRAAPLVVLYAADYPGMTGEPGPGLYEREVGALEAAEEVTARGVAGAVAAQPGVTVVGATEVTGAVRALADASAGAALVVVGTRGRGAIADLVFGSVGQDLTRQAEAPVAVVGERARSLDRSGSPRPAVSTSRIIV